MASGHTATEQARFIKKMRTSKILDSFQAGTLKDKHWEEKAKIKKA